MLQQDLQTQQHQNDAAGGFCLLLEAGSEDVADAHTHAGQQYASAVQKTLAYIDANLSGDLSLPHIAAVVGVSSGYLSTLFHRETGYTLAEYINSQRMKAAQQLLRSTRLQVQTIAQLVGFADSNYFGKQFKRFYGATPLQYRREQFNPTLQGST